MQGAVELEEFYVANGLLGDSEALRLRLGADGYLFFRGIVPAQRLLELRDQITRILHDIGWIRGGEDRLLAKAITLPCREGQPAYFEALDRILRLEALHSLAHEARLMGVMRQVLGDTVFPHPLSIVRLVFPDTPELATPPHQDYPNNQGTQDLTAAWVPLADCSVSDGALAILEGSHKFGLFPRQFHLGPGNRGAILSDAVAGCRWLSADFEAGDVLLFPSLTVHRALENRNPERMRLSVDFRYQLEGEKLTAGCLEPHFGRLSWEDIYQGWRSTQYQYYWRNKHYVEIPWDDSLQALPEEHLSEALRQEIVFERRVKQGQTGRACAESGGDSQ
ncbi:MAG: phytanoyl-CoA dioxygenase family protein [Halieaceae bacterium]|nr:phytanoyl-CoA dioxygenase family protein [Halieaceae bacterium]